jgi:hypothetical protein
MDSGVMQNRLPTQRVSRCAAGADLFEEAKTNADPSTPLRFAQDDSIVFLRIFEA